MSEPVTLWIAKVATAIVDALVAVGFSEATAIAILNFGVQLAGMALLNTVYDKLFMPDLGTSAQSFTVTIRGTIEHQRIIYGETLSSGLIWYTNTAGTNNQALYYAIVVAGHEIEDITDMWINDHRILNEHIDWAGIGAVTSGDFRGKIAKQEVVYFDKFLGTAGQVVSPDLDGAFTEITSGHAGKGIAWFLARFDFFTAQSQVWSNGPPDNIRGLVKGKIIYDPRSDGTQSFGTGPHRLVSSGTWEYNDNPALCWADYMIDNHLGFGESSARIDYGYVASAAQVCDGIVYTPVGTDKRFRCNGALSTGDAHRTNLERILASMNGTAALSNGQWKVRAWSYETPTLSFNDDNLRSDLQINLHPQEKQRYNTIRGTFIDKDRLWKSSQFPDFSSSEYLSRDNDRRLYRDISLHMVKDVYQAQRLAAGVLEQSDNEITAVVPTNYHALPIEIGGTIMVSNTKMGWVDKVFRAERYKFQDMGGIDLVVREDSAAAYTDVGTDEYSSITSDGGYTIANPGVPAPSSMWINPRVDGNLIHVTPPAARLYEEIILYTSPTSAFTDAEELTRIKDSSYFQKTDKPKTEYYWSSALNYAGDESVKLPNSDYSNIVSRPDLSGSRFDPTFDLSTAFTDFYEGAGAISASIDLSGGENGEHSMKLNHTAVGGQSFFRTKARLPISADEMVFRFRYKVSSFSGVNTPQAIVNFGAFGYHPSPVSSDKYITNPSTYTQVTGIGSFDTVGSLDLSGGWATYETRFPTTAAIDSAATVCAPYMNVTYSDTIVSDAYSLVMDINWISWYWA